MSSAEQTFFFAGEMPQKSLFFDEQQVNNFFHFKCKLGYTKKTNIFTNKLNFKLFNFFQDLIKTASRWWTFLAVILENWAKKVLLTTSLLDFTIKWPLLFCVVVPCWPLCIHTLEMLLCVWAVEGFLVVSIQFNVHGTVWKFQGFFYHSDFKWNQYWII